MKLKLDTKAINKVKKDLANIDASAAKVERYTISDIKRSVPPMVSKAVAEIYNIKQSEVAQAQRTKANLSDKAFKTANKKHLRTTFKGKDLSSLYVVFTGRKHANWNTAAKPKPKPRGSRVFATNKKYTVYQTVLKKQTVPISPKGGNRVFVMMRKGKMIPMVVDDNNEPMVHASTSVPQAVLNKQVVNIWRPKLHALVNDALGRHTKRYWKGEI